MANQCVIVIESRGGLLLILPGYSKWDCALYTVDAHQGLKRAAIKLCCWKTNELLIWGFSVFWRCTRHCPTPHTYPLPSSHLRTTVYLNWAVVSLFYENVLSLLSPLNSLKCGFFWEAFPDSCFPFLCGHSTKDTVILGEVIVSLLHKPEGTPCALLCSQGLKRGLKHGGHPVKSFWWLNTGLNEWRWHCSSLIVTEFGSQAEPCFNR